MIEGGRDVNEPRDREAGADQAEAARDVGSDDEADGEQDGYEDEAAEEENEGALHGVG